MGGRWFAVIPGRVGPERRVLDSAFPINDITENLFPFMYADDDMLQESSIITWGYAEHGFQISDTFLFVSKGICIPPALSPIPPAAGTKTGRV
jgi:hypothetical protein